MREQDRYLQNRGMKWYYVRRIPAHPRHLEGRHTIRVTLRTHSLEIACERRKAQEAVDDQYWATLLDLYTRPEIVVDTRKLQFDQRRYKAARARGSARSLSYIPADDLPSHIDLMTSSNASASSKRSTRATPPRA
jgi:hypothetical protein